MRRASRGLAGHAAERGPGRLIVRAVRGLLGSTKQHGRSSPDGRGDSRAVQGHAL
jgi:hypothetical protein